jgi:hypothetical protein
MDVELSKNKPQGLPPLRDNWPNLDDEIEAFGPANSMYELRRCLDDESQTSVHTLIHIGQNMCIFYLSEFSYKLWERGNGTIN